MSEVALDFSLKKGNSNADHSSPNPSATDQSSGSPTSTTDLASPYSFPPALDVVRKALMLESIGGLCIPPTPASGFIPSGMKAPQSVPFMSADSSPAISTTSLALSALHRRRRRSSTDILDIQLKKPKLVPEEQKDQAYWERRKKNNEAAKRSRDTRKAKEDEIALRAAYLEQENLKLKAQVNVLKNEMAKLHCLLFSQIQS